MGSHRPATQAKDQKKGKAKDQKKGKEPDTPKPAPTNDDKFRHNVSKTLWQAALSGKLDDILPKVFHTKEGSDEALSDTVKVAIDSTCDHGSASDSTECSRLVDVAEQDKDVATQGAHGLAAAGVVDLEHLRLQARQTFCSALLSGRLDQIIGQAKGKPTSTAVSEASPPCRSDIRKEVRATLETACRTGKLNEVLAQHRAAKSRHPVPAKFQREPQAPKAEDTRDIDQLLRELGVTATGKAAKSKKKAKKTASSQDSSGTASGIPTDKVTENFVQSKDDIAKLVAQSPDGNQVVLPEEVQSTSMDATTSSFNPDGNEETGSVTKGTISENDCDFLEGWQRIPPKAARRYVGSCEVGIASIVCSELWEESMSDSWAQQAPPSPAQEPISRKAPSCPTSLVLQRPALTEAVPREVSVPQARGAEVAAKRRALPAPPCGLPPPRPKADGHSSGGDNADSEARDAHLQPCSEVFDPMRSIQIWPDTPESTPPSSPRNYCDFQNEVLVPVPMHLLAAVQQLLMTGERAKAATGSTIAFGDVTI